MQRNVTVLLIIICLLFLGACSNKGTENNVIKKSTMSSKTSNSSETATIKSNKDNVDKKSMASLKPNESYKFLRIGFKFKHYLTTTDNAGEIPRTDISLIVSSDRTTEYKLGSYDGNAEEISKTYRERNHIPKNALITCMSWLAGGGDYFYVTRKNESTLSVMWRYIDASGLPDIQAYEPPFKEIEQLKIPKTDKIEISPLVEIEENS